MPAKAAAKKPEKKPSEGSSGSKAKKKKWSKGKVRDKLNNMVRFLPFPPLPISYLFQFDLSRSYSTKPPTINVSKICHNTS